MLATLAALVLVSSVPGLEPLIPNCGSTVTDGCGDFGKPVWKRFESATGEVAKLDTLSIRPMQGGMVSATIYTFVPGSRFDPSRLRQVMFTCRGQFRDLGIPGDMEDAPPRSVIGVIAATACSIAEPTRRALIQRQEQQQRQLDAVAHERSIHPRPDDYCQGFTAEACKRIQNGVDAPVGPSFCKPGFGRVGSGLNDEQLRICYARAPKDN
jgi:hypothetical protein